MAGYLDGTGGEGNVFERELAGNEFLNFGSSSSMNHQAPTYTNLEPPMTSQQQTVRASAEFSHANPAHQTSANGGEAFMKNFGEFS